MDPYFKKYLKYKVKYLKLVGGVLEEETIKKLKSYNIIFNCGIPTNNTNMNNQCLWISITDYLNKIGINETVENLRNNLINNNICINNEQNDPIDDEKHNLMGALHFIANRYKIQFKIYVNIEHDGHDYINPYEFQTIGDNSNYIVNIVNTPGHFSLIENIGTEIYLKFNNPKELIGVDIDNNLKITKVYPGSFAEKKGIKIGDQIIQFNKINISNYSNLIKLKEDVADNQPIHYTIKINNSTSYSNLKELKNDAVVDQPIHNTIKINNSTNVSKNIDNSSKDAVYVVTFSRDEKKMGFFLKPNLMIKEVYSNTFAEKKGIKEGDKIIQINGNDIENFKEFLIFKNNFNETNQDIKLTIIKNSS